MKYRYNVILYPGSPLYEQYPDHQIKGILLYEDRVEGTKLLEEKYGTHNGWAAVQHDGYQS